MTTINKAAAEVNLIITQGDDWSQTFRFGGRADADADLIYWDLTGWTGKCQFRKKATSTVILAELTVTFGPDQSVEDNRGYVSVFLPEEVSASLPRTCAWDFEMKDPTGNKKTYIAGTVSVNREVTRDV